MQQKRKLGALRRVQFIWINRDTGSFEWFQSLLKQLEEHQADADFLQINKYLTQKMDHNMATNIAIHDSAGEFDPLTNLRARTHFGRPNWGAIFGGTRAAIESGKYLKGWESTLRSKVGGERRSQSFRAKLGVEWWLTNWHRGAVFFCGPSDLARSIRREALASSSDNVKFSFAKEHFVRFLNRIAQSVSNASADCTLAFQ
jgi:NADPH oxidase